MNVRTARIATQSLAGICGGLLLLAVLQYAGIGRGYGWSGEARGATQRTRPSDVLRSTHVYAGSETRTSVWSARVPNGTYLVTICIGDDRPQGPHHVAVQGRQVVDARATAADEYLEIRDIPVAVRDGALSLALGGHRKPSVGKGGDSTLCWLQIRLAR